MSALDLTNPHEVPQELLELYFNQLFEHLDDAPKQAIRTRMNIRSWVAATKDSFASWLSYAVIEIYSTPVWGIRYGNHEITRTTRVHTDLLRTAKQGELLAYHHWAFDERVVGGPSLSGCSTGLVSPVHFWFFMSQQNPNPPRPISPNHPEELFNHPLFLIPRCRGPAVPFVVPEYFFRDDATFDGLKNLETSAYYMFPSFGRVLFDYLADPATPLGVGSFIGYYSAREAAWFIPVGTAVDRFVESPHPILKRGWRWEEVMGMLFNPQQTGVVRRPKISRNAPRGYNKDERIIAYFERFARMARIWRGVN